MPRVVVNQKNCKACYYCLDRCPKEVFARSRRINAGGYFPVEVVDEDKCTACMICYYICPDFAIAVFDGAQIGGAGGDGDERDSE